MILRTLDRLEQIEYARAMSDHPTHIRMYIGRQFHRILREESDRAFDSGDELRGLELRSWKLKLTGAKRGKAFYRWNKVTIPEWAIARGRAYATYYMLHELSHVFVGSGHGHDDVFKAKEIDLLSRYGLSITRRAAGPGRGIYPSTVTLNGDVAYSDGGRS